MVFSSLIFLFRFLPAVLCVYFITPRFLKNTVLFIASLIFYAWGEPIYVVLMLFSTVVDYTHGLLVQHFKDRHQIKQARIIVASSVIINLSLLYFFKYASFLAQSVYTIFGVLIPIPEVTLPIGISFYTFQTMSYTIDIYRGEASVQRNIISFGTYVSLFPQLIAGPIVRYKSIFQQLNKRDETWESFAVGVSRFTIGLGKKVLLANSIGLLWDTISAAGSSDLGLMTAWMGAFAFGFQIYFDFSGYSDMAIGLGSMFGFHFPENFHYPYLSRSITEFWRRWHISLGTWFREYVYILLGSNRNGSIVQLRNLLIVWGLTGLWHGASWNFVIWGLWFFFWIVLEKFVLLRLFDYLQSPSSHLCSKLTEFFMHIYTIVIVAVGWVLFAFERLNYGLHYIRIMFCSWDHLIDSQTLFLLSNYGLLFLLCTIGSLHLRIRLPAALKTAACMIIFLLCIVYLVDATYNPFLYFRF